MIRRAVRATAAISLAFLAAASARAQAPAGSPAPPPPEESTPAIFPHPEEARWWVSGQINLIEQWHPSFPAAYTGTNSLRAAPDNANSRVFTLYTGYELTPRLEALFDLETSSGRGIGHALGLAGFTNLDVVRSGTLGAKPYVARLMLRKIFALSKEEVAADRGPLGLASRLPARRLELRFGKFSLADFFDVNSFGSDSHLQLLNWTADNNGAYDYAADTRGYTVGAIIEYEERNWGVRFAETLMPRVANGPELQWNLRRARAENAEFELRRTLVPRHTGVLRLLGYANHANLGSYSEAIARFQAGTDPLPDVTAHPLQVRVKYGFGANLEQELTAHIGVFARWGWNEGQHESFAYTEVDQTLAAGARLSGAFWKRKVDRAGFAVISNGISRNHQQYLALGGLGFVLGDGRLTYGREQILEGYYTAHLWRGVYASFDLQHIWHPGYNRDRGPVLVPAVRLHLEL